MNMKKMVLVWAITFLAIPGHLNFNIENSREALSSQLGKRCLIIGKTDVLCGIWNTCYNVVIRDLNL